MGAGALQESSRCWFDQARIGSADASGKVEGDACSVRARCSAGFAGVRVAYPGLRALQGLYAPVLQQVCGQSLQTFADSSDAGRGGGFYGPGLVYPARRHVSAQLPASGAPPTLPSSCRLACLPRHSLRCADQSRQAHGGRQPRRWSLFQR